MRKLMLVAALGVAALTFGIGSALSQQSPDVKTLRGAAPTVDLAAPEVAKQNVSGRFDRAYRQQPPLVPHQVDRYQIDLKANQCLGCHDWSNAAKNGAPTPSMTHYLDRNGQQTDTVAGTRWFCNQCHVPQADAKELVENTFKPSQNVK